MTAKVKIDSFDDTMSLRVVDHEGNVKVFAPGESAEFTVYWGKDVTITFSEVIIDDDGNAEEAGKAPVNRARNTA